MVWITLTLAGGRGVRVNAAAIAYTDVDPRHTVVAFSAGRQLVVLEAPEEIEHLAAEAAKRKGARA